VVETPEQRVARLEAELARAKVDALEKELAAARAEAGGVPASTWTPTPLPQPDFGGDASGQPHFGGAQLRKASVPGGGSNLAPAPRAVPASYRMIVLSFSWWTLFTLLMISVAPIALWIAFPVSGVAVAAVAFVGVLVLMLRRSSLRNSLLKWGEPAAIVDRDVKSVGTYYSGTTVQNVRMAQAHGWKVERSWYSGPVTKTVVDYELRGTRGSLTIRGLPYDNGVILADSRKPERALCVSSFPYDLERDASGNWTGHVPTRVKVGAILMLDLLIGWTVAMTLICGNAANLW
jgi:hypothetical protein